MKRKRDISEAGGSVEDISVTRRQIELPTVFVYSKKLR